MCRKSSGARIDAGALRFLKCTFHQSMRSGICVEKKTFSRKKSTRNGKRDSQNGGKCRIKQNRMEKEI